MLERIKINNEEVSSLADLKGLTIVDYDGILCYKLVERIVYNVPSEYVFSKVYNKDFIEYITGKTGKFQVDYLDNTLVDMSYSWCDEDEIDELFDYDPVLASITFSLGTGISIKTLAKETLKRNKNSLEPTIKCIGANQYFLALESDRLVIDGYVEPNTIDMDSIFNINVRLDKDTLVLYRFGLKEWKSE